MKKILNILQQPSSIKILMLAIIICLPTIGVFANAGFTDDVEDVPIDGGLSLLVAAGVGYGAKQLRKKKNSESTTSSK